MENNLVVLRLVRRRRRAAERRRSLRLQRRQLRDASNAFELPEIRFVELFRLPAYWVLFLIETLTPFLGQTTRRSGVPVNLRVLAALNFYATGSYQRSVGEDYHVGLSQTMISRAINEVSLAIERHLMADWIKFPTTEAEKTAIKQRFMEKTGFPGVIGAIDCTHISILAPSVDGHNYRNRKGFHSKNVQIIADYDLKILNVNARFAGSTHDSYIWRNSVIRQHMLELHDAGVRGSWLLGDSGYPLEPWLMTPITNAADGSPEERYTACHARTRVCVERVNGVLKSVFRCLGADRILRYSPRVAGMIINACAVLHNMRVHMRLENADNADPDLDVQDDVPEAGDIPQNLYNEGRRIRANIVGQFR